MSANVNTSEEEFLNEMLSRLDSSFGNRRTVLKKFIDETKSAICNLQNSLAYQKVDEVAALVRKGEPLEVVQEKLHQNFPAGISIGKVEELLKLIYVGADCTENLINAINFVQVFESEHHAEAFRSVYDDAKFKNHSSKPEMLLLRKRIGQLQEVNGTILDQTKLQLDADCCKIISRVIAGIKKKDYSLSIYIIKKIDSELLDDIMPFIVQKLSNTLENFLLLIQYADKLPYIDNVCVLIDTLLKELEKRQLMASEQAMHLWVLAKFYLENPIFAKVNESTQKLCYVAIEKLSRNKHVFFGLYQKYVEKPADHNIKKLHNKNRHLLSILNDFVSFYYKGDLSRVQCLLAADKSINQYEATGRILTQLQHEMEKHKQLSSFEAFRIINKIKRSMSFKNFKTDLAPDCKKLFEQLKDQAPPCVHRLLWPESTSAKFLLVNKFFSAATLCILQDSGTIVCTATGASNKYHQTWKIAVDQYTSLLSLTNAQNSQEQLDVDGSLCPCLTQAGTKWMVKAIDQQHIKIFCNIARGEELFLTADITSGKEYHLVCLRRENNTDMQSWNICNLIFYYLLDKQRKESSPGSDQSKVKYSRVHAEAEQICRGVECGAGGMPDIQENARALKLQAQA